MLPTLFGRIQTRVVLLAVIGGLVTLIVVPFLPGGGTVGQHYRIGFLVLATVIVLGVGWEFVYHFLMQWRWEKDWPTFFGLATIINEGYLVHLLVADKDVPGINVSVDSGAFWGQFITVWVAVWLVANGPMRVPFLHWRFRGGRLA